MIKKKITPKKKQGAVTGFELATTMTVDKRSIHYALRIFLMIGLCI